MKTVTARIIPAAAVSGSIISKNIPKETDIWANRNRFWGLPIGVNILPVFAAIVCNTITRINKFFRSVPYRATEKGTNVSNATSFVISMLVKKHKYIRTAAKVRSPEAAWQTTVPSLLKRPQEEKPATTVISANRIKIVFQSI